VFYWVIVGSVAVTLPALLLLGGDRTAKALFAAGLAVYAAGATWPRWRASRDPADFHRDVNLILGGTPGALCGWAIMYYWGPFSPAPVVVAAALFINSLIGSRLYTSLLYGLLAGAHALLAVAVMTGLVVDRGLVSA